MSDDPYALLGLSRGATRAEITEAYRALAQIYHPDRYADAPPRVQSEANKRMQALNQAYEEARRAAPADQPPRRPRTQPPPPPPHDPGPAGRGTAPPRPPPPPPRNDRTALVHYVDGAPRFHSGEVAPLGFGNDGNNMKRVADASQCLTFNGELQRWFDQQQRNASLAARQLYNAWTVEEQFGYAAKLGSTRVPRDKARAIAVPCPECKP